jgi:16S rRNA (guanine966-N2)-methyltransferase
MRVIGGEARGRRIVAPHLPTLRPTSDRVREAMFDILEARGLVEGATVVDLFAGSGALGIEALSRGASFVTFVERDVRAVRAIESNLEAAGFSGRQCKIHRTDAETWLELHGGRSVDVLLADPPYDWTKWQLLFERSGAAFMLLEHRHPLEVGGHFEITRQYRYGGTLVTLVRDKRQSAAEVEPDSSDKDSF